METFRSYFPLVVYYLSGAASLVFGLYVFVGNTFDQEGHLHLEFASGLIFVGLVCFWCAYRFDRSAPVRYFVIVFFALMAGIHLVDYLRDAVPVSSPVFNALPFIGMLLVEWLRRPGNLSNDQISA